MNEAVSQNRVSGTTIGRVPNRYEQTQSYEISQFTSSLKRHEIAEQRFPFCGKKVQRTARCGKKAACRALVSLEFKGSLRKYGYKHSSCAVRSNDMLGHLIHALP